jgi:TonB family protein
MEQKKKSKFIGGIGALLVHAAVLALLFLLGFTLPAQEQEEGVPVMLGAVANASGFTDPSLVQVDVMPEEVAPQAEEVPEQPVITQDMEESVTLTPRNEATKPEVKKPEKSEAEIAAEAQRLAEEKAERERREAEEAARRRVAGSFGKSAQMGDKGTTEGTGVQGSAQGNVSDGEATGSGGYGTFDLGGRSLGEGGLVRPAINAQERGTVVINITVNPAGNVIDTQINLQRTNTVNAAMRTAAEDAARRTRFNAVDGLNNQSGTITYYFELK